HRLEGHAGRANSVALSPDGRRAISGGNGTHLWDLTDGRELGRFDGPETGMGIAGVAFSPDGSRVLTGGHKGMLQLWDAERGQVLCRFDGHTQVVQVVAFSPDGRRAYSGSHDGTIRLWDLAAATPVHQMFPRWHTGPVGGIAASPDGKAVASCGGDG